MTVKVESEQVGLKLNIQNTKTMASGPITSWQIDGETVETYPLQYTYLENPMDRGASRATVQGVTESHTTE